jgi:thiamine-phosphate pyrophosphorylase
VVNDRLDVALAAGAGGVHLRADSVPPRLARSLAPSGFLIGRSVHRVEDATEVEADVDYVIAGTVWSTSSKPVGHELLGVRGLAAITAAVQVPVLAIGGVTVETSAAAAAAGAKGVAGIGLFMPALPGTAAAGCRAAPLREIAVSVRTAFGIT